MPLTLTVGGGTVTFVQKSAAIALISNFLPAPSTAGNCLILTTSGASLSGYTTLNLITPWIKLGTIQQGVGVIMECWAYPNNPGGISTSPICGASTYVHMSEWSNVSKVATLDATFLGSTATATAGTTLSLVTGSSLSTTGDLALAMWAQGIAAGTPTFTTPTGWTRLIDDGATSSTVHTDVEYLVSPPTGSLSATLTSTATTLSAAGFVVVLKPAAGGTDLTAYIKNDSQTIKLNTYDFALLLGGRLLLENSTLDGYQLEDGSGVLLLDAYTPALGDPVTLANPTWTGRVVSLTLADIVDRVTNYALVTVAATNTSTAPGGTPPAPLGDSAVFGPLQLENGSGDYQLEDGSGLYLMENTRFAYRNLMVKQSQNQNGTTTVYGTLETFETGYQAGQALVVTSNNLFGQQVPSRTYTITNVLNTFVGVGTPVYVIEFGDTYQTMQLAGGGVLTKQLSQPAQQMGVVMPGGVLGYVQVTADQATITTAVDLTGLSVSVTVAAGRRIRISANAEFLSTIADDTAGLLILEGATVLGNFYRILSVVGRTEAASGQIILTPSAGPHTYKLQANRSGTGSVTMKADVGTSFSPAFLLVEDVGT